MIAQAGSSGEGMALAARTAELVFTAQQELAVAQRFYQDLRQQAAGYGRAVNDLLVLPGISTVVGRSRQEAQEKYEQLQQNLDPVVIFNSILSLMDIRLDIAALQDGQLDQPVQLAADIGLTQSHQSRQKLVLDWIRKHQPTYRQLLYHMGAGGHRTLIGTAEDIADDLQHWFESHAADGFMLM